jgi:serine/threonine protein phosphatase PrpC
VRQHHPVAAFCSQLTVLPLLLLLLLPQDSFCVHTAFNGDAEQHLFGVFDGHGDCGTLCSQFARDKVCFLTMRGGGRIV